MHSKTTKVAWVFGIVSVLSLTGCPYQSRVPIDTPSVEVEQDFLGSWVSEENSESEQPDFYEFKEMDNYRHEVIEHTLSMEDSTYSQKYFLSHFSVIDNIHFLNMRDGEGNYFLYKLEWQSPGESFVMYEVTDNIDEQFDTSEDLKAFIKNNMHLSFFYNKDEKVYLRHDK